MTMGEKTILIVEDDGIIAIDLKETLSRLGYAVLDPVATGDRAIAAATENRPDLVLMDVDLPGRLNATEASETIRANLDIPVVYLTGYSRDPLLQQAKVTAPYGYLVKPVPDRELVATIEIALYRHNLDRKLKESEERYRKITDTMIDYIFTVTVKNRKAVETLHSHACVAVTGYTVEEFSDDPNLWITMVHQEDREAVMRQAEDILNGRSFKAIEHRIIRKDGKVRWVRNTPVPYHDRTGRLVSYDGIIQDITEKKQAEEKYQTIFEQAVEGIYQTTPEGRFLQANPSLARMLGYDSPEELVSTIIDIGSQVYVDPSQRREVKRTLEENGTLSNYEARLRRRDGSIIWVSIGGATFRTDYGSILYFQGSMVDITERKQAEEEMMKLTSAIEQAAECVVITDPKGLIQYVNPAFERITGYSKEEAMGQNPRILKSGMQDDAFYKGLWETITSECTWSGRFVNRRKNGTLYHEDASISPIRDKAGNIVNFVAVKKDITKEIELEEQLLRSQKLEAIGTLAGGIAHDFNNILSAIIGFSGLVKEEVPRKSPAYEHVMEVLHAGERARDLVKQILTFSHQVGSRREPVKVQLIARETIKLLRSSIPKNITIIDRINPGAGPVDGDPAKIHQLIINLCTNAYHAMVPDGGDLTMTLNTVHLDENYVQQLSPLKVGAHLRLIVNDTGCGMDEHTMKRIFDPFFTTKEKGKGTGLGLATVYGIATDLGGAITVDSKPGGGSTFSVYLPISERLPAEDLPKEEYEEPTLHKKGHIMVVDDEESIIHFTRIMLDQLGYTVTSLISSMDALMLFRSAPQRYDLVITDQVMPEMTGLQLSVELLKIRPELPIIIMTGYSESVDQDKAKAAGIREYIEKPFTKRLISQVIRRQMGE
jgi:PAS domain S-box-containing protein